MQHPIRAISARALVLLAVLLAAPALTPSTAAAQDTTAAAGIDPALLTQASWHGRPIQRPIPRTIRLADRSPGLTRGTGYRTPTGSRRVRDLLPLPTIMLLAGALGLLALAAHGLRRLPDTPAANPPPTVKPPA